MNEQEDVLFNFKGRQPLAERMRPSTLEEVVGQNSLLGKGGPLFGMLNAGRLASIILWGPPGSGKTTIARLLADRVGLRLQSLSAVFAGVSDLKKIFEQAERELSAGSGTLLFIDEIHRFNRTQQDSFLPFVEKGTVILVGATTENPSFELNSALLSRCQVLVLERLDTDSLEVLLQRAEIVEQRPLPVDENARVAIRSMADGDGRFLLNLCEQLYQLPDEIVLDNAGLCNIVQRRSPIYDKGRDTHYNLISALHKSLRGSDTDAALYWLSRMLVGGEDPRYIARRLLRFAYEDVGLADPNAGIQALASWQAYERLGSPEGELALAQAVIYLSTAPKSNASYKALELAKRAAKEKGSFMPPSNILNAPTKLMASFGYGKDYAYDHDFENAYSGQNYFPELMPRQSFYEPVERGFEREIQKRLKYWSGLRQKITASD